MIFRLQLIFFVFIVSPLFATPNVDGLFSQYDRPDVPGASVGVYRNGQILFEKGYGLASVDSNEKASALTNYRLASLTKAFTAMAIMILLDENKLFLDDKLTNIFTDFPSYGNRISIRHLLNHQSGLRDYEDLIPASFQGQVKDKDVLGILKNSLRLISLPVASTVIAILGMRRLRW